MALLFDTTLVSSMDSASHILMYIVQQKIYTMVHNTILHCWILLSTPTEKRCRRGAEASSQWQPNYTILDPMNLISICLHLNTDRRVHTLNTEIFSLAPGVSCCKIDVQIRGPTISQAGPVRGWHFTSWLKWSSSLTIWCRLGHVEGSYVAHAKQRGDLKLSFVCPTFVLAPQAIFFRRSINHN